MGSGLNWLSILSSGSIEPLGSATIELASAQDTSYTLLSFTVWILYRRVNAKRLSKY